VQRETFRLIESLFIQISGYFTLKRVPVNFTLRPLFLIFVVSHDFECGFELLDRSHVFSSAK
jgi:hypothetical protein